MHADLSSLQESIQIILSQHASRYIAVAQHESNRRRNLTQSWQIDVDNFINAHPYKLSPISHVTGTSLAILEADLQSACNRTHITLLEALHSQWLEFIPTAAASNNELNLPLTRSTKSLLERLIRAIHTVNVPINFSVATRLAALSLPYVAIVPEIRLVPSLLQHNSENFLSTEVLPYAPQNLHPFDPTTVTHNNEHPLAHIPDAQRHISQPSTTSQDRHPSRSQSFSYRSTTNRLPQVPIVLPILNDPPPTQIGTIWPVFPDLQNLCRSYSSNTVRL